MNYSKYWKKILIIWIAICISVSGYYYIFPIVKEYTTVEHRGKGWEGFEYHYGPKIIKHIDKIPVDKVCFLIMIVGIILIGGFGKLSTDNKEKNIKHII